MLFEFATYYYHDSFLLLATHRSKLFPNVLMSIIHRMFHIVLYICIPDLTLKT